MNQNTKRASTVTTVTTVTDPFPINVLPPIVRQMVEEVADVATVPHALPACAALGIISSALGAGLAIPSDRERKTFGNLYLAPAAESGSGKSVAFKHLMAPVYEYQEELRAKAEAARYRLKAELFNLEGTLRRVKSGRLLVADDDLAALIKRQEEIERELKRRPKIVCEDVTREKLQLLLAQNDERMFSASADARQVIQAVLHGKGDNPYLKAWSGDPTDVDRISRDAVPLREPRMTLLWCPQPDLMTDMFARRILTDNGFLPRVLPCQVDCTLTSIGHKSRRVESQTEKDWHDLVLGLFAAYHAKQGAPFVLKRSAKVQRMLVDYYNSVVERRRSELAGVGPFAARWAEQGWRLVVVLHAATYGRDAHNEVVQVRTAEDAISLMDFFSQQQIELLRHTRAQAKTEAEKAILLMLSANKPITARDAQREHIADNAADAHALLEQMVLAGKLVFHDHKPERGGHPTRVYRRCDSRDTCGAE